MKRTDCIFYQRTGRREHCGALKELYCAKEKCKFYKAGSAYNPDGSRKAGDRDAEA